MQSWLSNWLIFAMRALVEEASVRRDSKTAQGGREVEVSLRSAFFAAICALNVVPLVVYLPTATHYAKDTAEVTVYHWYWTSALGSIFVLNMLCILKISYLSTSDQFILAFVPFVIFFLYGFGAATEALRFLDPTSGRPIFATRYVAWLVTVPVLILEGAPLSGLTRESLHWTALLTNSYIMCAWGAQLSPSPGTKWWWVLVSFSTFALTCYETISIIRSFQPEQCTFLNFTGSLFMFYGGLYLLSELDIVSVVVENVVFGFFDALSKAVFSAYILTSRVENMHMEVLSLKRYAECIVEKSAAPMFVVRCNDRKIIQWNNGMAQVA